MGGGRTNLGRGVNLGGELSPEDLVFNKSSHLKEKSNKRGWMLGSVFGGFEGGEGKACEVEGRREGESKGVRFDVGSV